MAIGTDAQVCLAGGATVADHDDAAIRLDDHRLCSAGQRAESNDRAAIPVERGIQRTVRVVAHHGRIQAARVAAAAGHHDATGAIQRHVLPPAGATRDTGGDGPRPAEGHVERPVGEQPGHGVLIREPDADMPGQDDPAVGLQDDAVHRRIEAEIDGGISRRAESEIQRAVFQVARRHHGDARPEIVGPGHNDLAIGLHDGIFDRHIEWAGRLCHDAVAVERTIE